IGTTSPWAKLSINPVAADGSAPAFAIGSTTATNFVVTNAGTVGIGTANPGALFDVKANGGSLSPFKGFDNGVISAGSDVYSGGNLYLPVAGLISWGNSGDRGYINTSADGLFKFNSFGGNTLGLSYPSTGTLRIGNGTLNDFSGTVITGTLGLGT